MRKGFTIIEFLVAFALVILTIGVSANFLRSALKSETLEQAARTLASDLRYASELASATQTNHEVRLTLPADYSIVRIAAPEVIVKKVTLDPTLSFSSITLPANTATFNTLGAAASTGAITLVHVEAGSKTINLRPSGYVKIQ